MSVTALHEVSDTGVSMNLDSISVSATRGTIQTGATRLDAAADDVHSCLIGPWSFTGDATRGDRDDREVWLASDAPLSQREQIWFTLLESLVHESKCQVSEKLTAPVFLSTSQHSCTRNGLGPDCCVALTQACACASRSVVPGHLAVLFWPLFFCLRTYLPHRSSSPSARFFLVCSCWVIITGSGCFVLVSSRKNAQTHTSFGSYQAFLVEAVSVNETRGLRESISRMKYI